MIRVFLDSSALYAAINSQVDYLVTFDRKHLINPPEVSKNSGLLIVTPGEVVRGMRN